MEKKKLHLWQNFQHYEFLIPTTNYAQTFVEIRFIIQVTIKYLVHVNKDKNTREKRKEYKQLTQKYEWLVSVQL